MSDKKRLKKAIKLLRKAQKAFKAGKCGTLKIDGEEDKELVLTSKFETSFTCDVIDAIDDFLAEDELEVCYGPKHRA